LFKSEKDYLVTLQNYETFFLLYLDDELNVAERKAVDDFVHANPSLQQELDILRQARVSPDQSIVYPDKQLLYREAGKEKVVTFSNWRMLAVAAMLLLALGILWINSTNHTQDRVADGNPPAKNNNREEQVVKKADEAVKPQTNQSVLAGTTEQTEKTEQVKNTRVEKKNSKQIPPIEKAPMQIAQKKVEDDGPAIRPTAIAKVEAIDVKVTGSSNLSSKTLIVDKAYSEPQQDKNVALTRVDLPSDEVAIGPVQTKNKLRGFFRQVTRVVEKTTHLPAGENKKILIGNIEIALK
jgi:hypothetical protein